MSRVRGGDRGETLIELLVALGIMGVAVVALVGGLGIAVVMSDVHRKQATADMTLRNYVETVTGAVATGAYPVTCDPPSVTFAAPAGFTASILPSPLRYWTGSDWSSSCAADTGARQLTLRVASVDGRAAEQLVVVVRKPCGLAEGLCG